MSILVLLATFLLSANAQDGESFTSSIGYN